MKNMADGRGVGGVFSGIVEKVSFLSQLPLLSRATSDDDEPIPGYWLEEIKTGCEAHSVQLAEFLSAALYNRSGRVKLKALRIMEFIAQHDIAFREAVSRDEGCLKEAVKWLSPAGASGLQEAVRARAGKVIESLHAPDWVPVSARQSLPGLGTAAGTATPTQGKMPGFGRSTHREESATEKVRGLLDSLFGPSESQSDRSIRQAFASDKGQYQRVPMDRSRPIVGSANRSPSPRRPGGQSDVGVTALRRGKEADVADVERFCSETDWPVSRMDLQHVARCVDLDAAVSALAAILERGGGAEIRALLLVEALLRRGAAANQMQASLSRLADRDDEPAALKARKVLMLMDGVDSNTTR